jgi:hypothetical protein
VRLCALAQNSRFCSWDCPKILSRFRRARRRLAAGERSLLPGSLRWEVGPTGISIRAQGSVGFARVEPLVYDRPVSLWSERRGIERSSGVRC